DTHDSISVNYDNSILNRFLKLLNYLDTNFPTENWGQYLLNDTTVNWQSVVIAGHSQGAGHATFGSKFFEMDRVIMFSWVDWMHPGTNPSWITQPGQTPDSAYFGFIHTGDASIYNGIHTTWTNLGMNPFGEITDTDNTSPPYNNSHSLITSAPINHPPTQVNFHNATCVDWVTTITQSGDTLYKPVWEYLLGNDLDPTPDANAVKISPDDASYIDPEILSSENKLAFQMGNGNVWLSDLDPNTGLFSSANGLDVLVDVDATPLVVSINGPEFGVDSNGWSLVYTKPNEGTPQAWRAIVNDTIVTNIPLTSGVQPRLSILASKDPNASSTKILYSKGPSLNNGEFGWADVINPASETIVDSTDNGVRWIDDSQKFFYTKQTGSSAGQVFLYDTDTSSEIQVTNDDDVKTYPYGWFAPEYNNELIFLVLLNDTTMGIYKDNGNPFWDRIFTIEVPPASSFDFIGSPEAFVTNNKSYISFVTKEIATGSSYVDAEVWVVDIEPDINNRLMLRCDDGLPNTKRTDPESYIGANEVFIYYNQINNLGEFEIWRYATGISTFTAIDENSTYNPVMIYPNPASNYINLNLENLTSLEAVIYDLNGRRVKTFINEKEIYVGDLTNGIYILEIKANEKIQTYKLIKE
ncbi:MAG: T9SS type A sorting domain-containing protein, partial [Cyclobacteriaceae bacterium]